MPLENEKEWFIQAPWGKICIIAWGECCRPPVLICHGIADCAVSFRPLISYLPQQFYYIGIELPGCGKSDRFPPGLMLSLHDMLYAVEAVVNHFGWRSFTYIGHAFGALLGKFYNIVYPGKMSKIVELDPIEFKAVPPEHFAKWYTFYFTNYYKQYVQFNGPVQRAPLFKWTDVINVAMNNRDVSEDQAVDIMERLTQYVGNGLVRYTQDPRMKLVNYPPFSPEHVRKLFTAVTTPMLIIASGNSLASGLFRNTEFLLDQCIYPAGNVRTKIIRGGHNAYIGYPEESATYIGQFLLNGLDGIDARAKL